MFDRYWARCDAAEVFSKKTSSYFNIYPARETFLWTGIGSFYKVNIENYKVLLFYLALIYSVIVQKIIYSSPSPKISLIETWPFLGAKLTSILSVLTSPTTCAWSWSLAWPATWCLRSTACWRWWVSPHWRHWQVDGRMIGTVAEWPSEQRTLTGTDIRLLGWQHPHSLINLPSPAQLSLIIL